MSDYWDNLEILREIDRGSRRHTAADRCRASAACR